MASRDVARVRRQHRGRVPARLSDITITASDFAASLAFHHAALGALGLARVLEFGDEEQNDPEVEAASWGRATRHPSCGW